MKRPLLSHLGGDEDEGEGDDGDEGSDFGFRAPTPKRRVRNVRQQRASSDTGDAREAASGTGRPWAAR